MKFGLLIGLGVLFGIGFGFLTQRAGLCFAHGLGEIFIGRGRRIIRFFIIIFVITSLGFLASHWISPQLGLRPIGQIRGYGFFNILSGLFFGAGIFLNGGCILGTLRQIGEGNMFYLVVFVSFIPGMALVVYLLDPFLQSGYQVQCYLLPDLIGIKAIYITLFLVLASIIWYLGIRKVR